jgi:hypothetical protein
LFFIGAQSYAGKLELIVRGNVRRFQSAGAQAQMAPVSSGPKFADETAAIAIPYEYGFRRFVYLAWHGHGSRPQRRQSLHQTPETEKEHCELTVLSGSLKTANLKQAT